MAATAPRPVETRGIRRGMRLTMFAVFLACAPGFLSACSSGPLISSEYTPPPSVSDPLIGQTRWFKSERGTRICPDPRALTFLDSKAVHNDQCFTPGGEVAFSVIRAEPGVQVTPFAITKDKVYLVRLQDGRQGYVKAEFLDSLESISDADHRAALADEAAHDCKRHPQPRIGMSWNELLNSCWGRPIGLNTTETSGGRRDQVVYQGKFGSRNYVYLTNSVVTAIQVSH